MSLVNLEIIFVHLYEWNYAPFLNDISNCAAKHI